MAYINATVEEILEHLQVQVNTLRKKAEDTIPQFKDLPKAPVKSEFGINLQPSYYFKIKRGYYSSERDCETEEEVNLKLEEFKRQCDKYLEEYKTYADEAQTAWDHNQKVAVKLAMVMEQAGIRATYSEYTFKSPRSKNKDWMTKSAGYLGDIARYNKSFTSYDTETSNVKHITKQYEEYACSLRSKLREQEREKDKQKKNQQMLHELAALRVKYTPDDYSSEPEEILKGILSKDKYLSLADAMLEVRNYWGDGCKSVYYEAAGFEIVTTEDKEIQEEILSLCEDFQDGRVFRDAQHSYDYLFSKVDENLYADYLKVKEMLDEDA